MHTHDLSPWQHRHDFTPPRGAAERRTRLVLALTLAAMCVEIAAGWLSGSMALLADGWHMSSHALAIGLSVFAYAAARRLAGDGRFAFGTWKIEVLSGFVSALMLLGVAALMVWGSVQRLLAPQPIHYLEALGVAALGLAVNVASALMLGHSHDHDHDHDHGRTDLNLRAAYVHVLADAATSVLAMAALLGGWLWGWDWLDPLMGMVGAVLVAVWAKGLLVTTARVLLDEAHRDISLIVAAIFRVEFICVRCKAIAWGEKGQPFGLAFLLLGGGLAIRVMERVLLGGGG